MLVLDIEHGETGPGILFSELSPRHVWVVGAQ